jgi:AcrR family transcriptional regulator
MGRRDKSESRRKEILEAAYQVVAKSGLEGATLKSIGEEMGVAPSLLMHYFANKLELVQSLVDYMIQKMDTTFLDEMAALPTARQRLELFLEKNLSFELPESVDNKVFYGAFYLSLSDERVRESFRAVYDHDRALISRLVAEYAQEARLHHLRPGLLAIQIVSFIEGLYLYKVVYGDSQELCEAVEGVRKIIWEHLEGRPSRSVDRSPHPEPTLTEDKEGENHGLL